MFATASAPLTSLPRQSPGWAGLAVDREQPRQVRQADAAVIVEVGGWQISRLAVTGTVNGQQDRQVRQVDDSVAVEVTGSVVSQAQSFAAI
jgi:hypothetical protein